MTRSSSRKSEEEFEEENGALRRDGKGNHSAISIRCSRTLESVEKDSIEEKTEEGRQSRPGELETKLLESKD